MREGSVLERHIKQWVKVDAFICLQLLHLANSRSFGKPGQVQTLEEVFQVLEIEPIRDCLLSQVSRVSMESSQGTVALNDLVGVACAQFTEALVHADGIFNSHLLHTSRWITP